MNRGDIYYMQIIENSLFTVLIPDKGYKLVNKSTGKNYKKVILGKNDSTDNYTEEIDEKYINPEILEEVDNIKEKINNNIEESNIIVDLLLYSVDELYTSVEPVLAMIPMTIETENKVNKLVNFYVLMIKRGLKNIEEIPERFREEVNKLFNTFLTATFIFFAILATLIFIFAEPILQFIIHSNNSELVSLSAMHLKIMTPVILIGGIIGIFYGLLITYRCFLLPNIS